MPAIFTEVIAAVLLHRAAFISAKDKVALFSLTESKDTDL